MRPRLAHQHQVHCRPADLEQASNLRTGVTHGQPANQANRVRVEPRSAVMHTAVTASSEKEPVPRQGTSPSLACQQSRYSTLTDAKGLCYLGLRHRTIEPPDRLHLGLAELRLTVSAAARHEAGEASSPRRRSRRELTFARGIPRVIPTSSGEQVRGVAAAWVVAPRAIVAHLQRAGVPPGMQRISEAMRRHHAEHRPQVELTISSRARRSGPQPASIRLAAGHRTPKAIGQRYIIQVRSKHTNVARAHVATIASAGPTQQPQTQEACNYGLS